MDQKLIDAFEQKITVMNSTMQSVTIYQLSEKSFSLYCNFCPSSFPSLIEKLDHYTKNPIVIPTEIEEIQNCPESGTGTVKITSYNPFTAIIYALRSIVGQQPRSIINKGNNHASR
jgi:hypothetical protein